MALIDPVVRIAIENTFSGKAAWPLFVYGSAGTGKTCAGLCLLDYCGGVYFSVGGLCQHMIEANKGQLCRFQDQEGPSLSPSRLWQLIHNSTLAVLDELGARSTVSDFHYDCVKRFLDERQGKPLLVLSNHPLDRLEKLYDDRVASRLAAGTVVELCGKDRRLS